MKRMNLKGQASIELILLLVVILLLVHTLIMPSFDIAQKSANDVSSIVNVRNSAQRLANAIELVDSSAAGARQTIHLMVPNRSQLFCWGDFTPGSVVVSGGSGAPGDYVIQPGDNPKIAFVIKPELDSPEACAHDFLALYDPSDPELKKACAGLVPLNLSTQIHCTRGIQRIDQNSAGFYDVTVTKELSGTSFVVKVDFAG